MKEELTKLFRSLPPDILRNETIVKIAQILYPENSCCSKCGLPWRVISKIKSVDYAEGLGTFATCDVCWDNSTLDELYGYYTSVYNMQKAQGFLMSHTLLDLLKAVCVEYYRTHH